MCPLVVFEVSPLRRQIRSSNTEPSVLIIFLWLGLTNSWRDYITVLSLRTVPPVRWERCHCRAVQMAIPAWPHLWIIWTQIVYLVFLKCYHVSSVHLCPLYKKKNSPTPLQKPPPKTTRPSGRCTDFPMTTNKMGAKLSQRTPFTLTPSFLQAVPVQKCTETLHKEVIQASSAEGNPKMLGRVAFFTFYPFERKTSL